MSHLDDSAERQHHIAPFHSALCNRPLCGGRRRPRERSPTGSHYAFWLTTSLRTPLHKASDITHVPYAEGRDRVLTWPSIWVTKGAMRLRCRNVRSSARKASSVTGPQSMPATGVISVVPAGGTVATCDGRWCAAFSASSVSFRCRANLRRNAFLPCRSHSIDSASICVARATTAATTRSSVAMLRATMTRAARSGSRIGG